MPKYNELKHFNPATVAGRFLGANDLKLGTETMTTLDMTKTGMNNTLS
jgi:hypothetical protein|tara:strand:+ start:484 stop:627 length:144 start_codon:yes stop_codon:yes gene_type:complete